MSIDTYINQGTPQDVRVRYNSLKELAETLDFGYLDDEVVVLDTETTGLSFKKEELTQIAAARMKKGEIVEWFVTFVNPGKHIPQDITNLTHISDEDVQDAPTPFEARAQLVSFVGDCPIVAHNAAFDFNFCTKDAAGEPLKSNLWIDSLDIARIALVQLNSFRLKELALAFGAPPSTHRADADVEALCAIYRYLLAAVAAMPPDLVEKISTLAPKEQWPTSEVFRVISNIQKASYEAQADVQLSKGSTIPFSLSALRRRRIHALDLRQVQRVDIAAPVVDVPGIAKTSTFGSGEKSHKYIHMPLEDEIDEAFSADGLFGSLYDNYECREEQVIMAKHVLKAFSLEQNLVVEAGTGVGKSMAYLLPAALTAIRNNITIGVATKTNTLLDQLIYKELPALATALKNAGEADLRFASIKGFSHYPCLRKVNKLISAELRMAQVNGEEVSQAPIVAQLLSFIEQSEYNDLDAVPLHRQILPRYLITSDSRECMRKKCPFYDKLCFTHGKRKQAQSAHIVVTNHSLFFIDAASPAPLLPQTPFWIVDEAHGAEDAARSAMAQRFSAYEAKRLADMLAAEGTTRNPFIALLQKSDAIDQSKQPEAASLFFGLIKKAEAEGKVFSHAIMIFLQAIKGFGSIIVDKSSSYDRTDALITSELMQTDAYADMFQAYADFDTKGSDFVKHVGELLAFIEDMDALRAQYNDIAIVSTSASILLEAAKLVLETSDVEHVRYITASKRLDVYEEQLSAEHFDVGNELRYSLYEQTRSVVYASATIDVGDNFTSFSRAVGLVPHEQVYTEFEDEPVSKGFLTCKLGSSYDYDTNMKVFVVTDLPEPNTSAYNAALSKLLIEIHIALNGSVLSLFTSKKAMNESYEIVKEGIKGAGLQALCQGRAGSKKAITDNFLADKHLSLFATKSFWEGFDAPGDTLRGVVITRLPFSNPSSPLSQERKRRYNDDWARFTLPASVVEFKQAAGRLIRSAEDTGVLILTDPRLNSKSYGRKFLQALPSKNITMCTAQELPEYLSKYR